MRAAGRGQATDRLFDAGLTIFPLHQLIDKRNDSWGGFESVDFPIGHISEGMGRQGAKSIEGVSKMCAKVQVDQAGCHAGIECAVELRAVLRPHCRQQRLRRRPTRRPPLRSRRPGLRASSAA
eukprot:7385330-Prymnesium_polylepis.2